MTACEALGHVIDLSRWMQDFRVATLTAADLPCARCGRTLHIIIRADVFDTPAERGREIIRRITQREAVKGRQTSSDGESNMTRWEYYVYPLPAVEEKEDRQKLSRDVQIEDGLNLLGQEGWECFAVAGNRAYMKRQYRGEPK